MSLQWTEVDDIPGGIDTVVKGKWTLLVKTFADSGCKAARVYSDTELETPSAIEAARISMAVAAKRNGLPVRVCRREGKLFLVRENDE